MSFPIVSVLADGPYWRSILEILTVPSGTSFYRSFNYRPDWVSDEVLGVIPQSGSKDYDGGIIGLQSSENPEVFVPIRRIQRLKIRKDGDVRVDLVLGDYIAIDTGTNDLKTSSTPAAQQKKGSHTVLLRFGTDSEKAVLGQMSTKPEPDTKLWSTLAQSSQLSDKSKANLIDSVVLYATRITNLRTGVQVSATDISVVEHHQGQKQGYKLDIDEAYEIALNTDRIVVPGVATRPKLPEFELINDSDDFAASVRLLPVTGNYRQTSVWVKPRKAQPAPIDVWFNPKQDRAQQGQPASDEKAIGIRLPVSVAKRVPKRDFVTAACFVCVGATSFWFAAQQDPKAGIFGVLISAGALFLSAGITFASSGLAKWERQSG